MNQGLYREGRVRVSEQVLVKLMTLLEHEDDFAKKKKHPAQWYRYEVAKTLKLAEKDNPSLRSYEDKIAEFKKNRRQPSPLDRPWSVGACVKYHIPPETIPRLLKQKRRMGTPKTIREMLWCWRLYPAMKDYLERDYPNDLAEQAEVLSSIVRYYCLRERFAEIRGELFPDTSELDRQYLSGRKRSGK